METKVEKNSFTYGGTKYFRRKADSIEMAAFGQKKDSLAGAGYLAVENQVSRENLRGRVRYATRAKVDWSNQKQVDVETNGELKYFSLKAEGALTASLSKAKEAKLELLKFVIDEGDLKAMLNQDANRARRYLEQERRDGRIVSEIWVVVEVELAENFSAAGSTAGAISAALTDAAKLKLAANHSGSSNGSATIVFEPGTTFAYLMHKVTGWNKDWTRIEDMEDDRSGVS